ncbi:MAG: molybdopterin synthase sulfur carrier subunit, partial [Phenylobacterium sp.]|nr:molybdopterin synthase sulfur carrier subunit [Phenylobacterium sp.]
MARVLLFGRLADLAGWRERDIPAVSLADLRGRIATEDPAL